MNDPFPFDVGDTVIINRYEDGGTDGRIVAKLVAECVGIRATQLGPDIAQFYADWASPGGTTFSFGPDDATFEPVADGLEVSL